MKFTDEQIESLILSIYNGSVDSYNLPVDLYMAVGNYLEKGLFKGFGGELVDFSGSKLELLQSLRENVWLFSGAKTFQTVSAMEAMLSDNGEMRTFKEFKEFAREKYDLYNDTWAKTEYQTAIGQGQNAERWAQIEADKDVFPKLRYSAVIDANTSEICAPLNGLVFNVDDPEVDVISPENHFNCFTPETLIYNGDGETRIDKLNVGDVVITSKYRKRKVTYIHKNEFKGELVRFLIGASKWIYCTENHPILTTDGWKNAGDINDSDWLVTLYGLKKPKKITKEFYEGLVYNLTVDEDETYVLGCAGIIVHNCRCLWEQVEEDVPLSENRKEVSSSVAEEMNDAFKNNVGKTGEVFGADHPYFTDIPKEDRDYAQRNFDLEIPE